MSTMHQSLATAIALTSTILLQPTDAFLASPVPIRSPPSSTRLRDIHEWRDMEFDDLPSSDESGDESSAVLTLPPKHLCLLPFSFPEALLQGETKQLRLYEDRFLELFQDAVDNHGSMVGMGLVADSGIIQTVPLCELEAFHRMDGFGIFCTIRVVGRAKLKELFQMDPYFKSTCKEVHDEAVTLDNLDLPNRIATEQERLIGVLCDMEAQVEQLSRGRDGSDESNQNTRKINLDELEDRFYLDDDDDDDDDEDDGEEDEDGASALDRRQRFQQAFQVAMNTDTQGYQVCNADDKAKRTVQELTALSWAVFCTEPNCEKDATFRIQALDADNLMDRLKLGLLLLRQKESKLRARVADLQQKNNDSADEGA